MTSIKLLFSSEELDDLCEGAHIIDGAGLHAVKRNGAWLYDTGKYWEPSVFPVRAIIEKQQQRK